MRVFSGIRPSGEIHIGNYLGAIKNWVALQDKANCVFCIVDLHALTTPYKEKELQKNIFDMAVTYLAAGLDPKKCIFFVQSQVKEHSELAWLLSTVTPLGELQRMTQFKEKSQKHPNGINAGLLNYPVLMAADILLYQTDIVPVGEDQKQHVELSREIARKFNRRFDRTFKLPEAQIEKSGAKIMSLQNPVKKMSKTDSPASWLGLFESPKMIKQKIGAAVTDSGKEIIYRPKEKPGISNLLAIYSLFSGKAIKKIEKGFQKKSYFEFKQALTGLLSHSLSVFREKRKELLKRKSYVQEILTDGAEKARAIASDTLTKVKQKMGLM